MLDVDEVEVQAALSATTANFRNGEHLLRTWALEDWKLGRLGSKLFKEAMTSEGATAYQAAVAYCRISSRRAELCGANAPISHAVTLMQAAAPPQLNSTQQIAMALAHAKGENPTEEEIRQQWGGTSCPGDPDHSEQQQAQPPNTRIREVLEDLRATSPNTGEGEAN
jgi:hypothetical protein